MHQMYVHVLPATAVVYAKAQSVLHRVKTEAPAYVLYGDRKMDAFWFKMIDGAVGLPMSWNIQWVHVCYAGVYILLSQRRDLFRYYSSAPATRVLSHVSFSP